MNRLLSLMVIGLCGLFVGAFIADADTLIEGDKFQVSREKNTLLKTPDLVPKLTNEASYCIVNETATNFSVFINDEAVWMEPGMFIWGRCQNLTEEYFCEIESQNTFPELITVVVSCGDILKIQARK